MAILSAILLLQGSGLQAKVSASKSEYVPTASGSKESAWSEVTAWLKDMGATVNSKVAGNLTLHGGAWIPGVIATKAMYGGEVILSIPKHLLLHLDNFDVPNLSQMKCSTEDDEWDRELQAGIAVALEIKKGQASKWHVLLKTIPTLENFQSFYIKMASPQLLQQFHGLPLARRIADWQQDLEELKPCINEWQQKHGHGDLSWEDFQHGLAFWQTRVHQVFGDSGKTSAVAPAVHLFNTRLRYHLNTLWNQRKVGGVWHARPITSDGIASGDELYANYCKRCANDKFLEYWSFYLDENDQTIKDDDDDDDDACENESMAMKTLVQEMLGAPEMGLSAPRCKKEVFEDFQGQIKCAFARLAWEQYGKSWGLNSPLKPSA